MSQQVARIHDSAFLGTVTDTAAGLVIVQQGNRSEIKVKPGESCSFPIFLDRDSCFYWTDNGAMRKTRIQWRHTAWINMHREAAGNRITWSCYSEMPGGVADSSVVRYACDDFLIDGVVVNVVRLPEIDEICWAHLKKYLSNNIELTKEIREFSEDPVKLRDWLRSQPIADLCSWTPNWENRDALVKDKLDSFRRDKELRHIVDDIHESGIEAVIKYWDDSEVMVRLSERTGHMPESLLDALRNDVGDPGPRTIHDAAKVGDALAVARFMKKSHTIDQQDVRGITPLGYAVGNGHKTIALHLMLCKANPHGVDAEGNSALHYAAGYGHKQIIGMIMKSSGEGDKNTGTVMRVNQTNKNHQTPLTVATMNRHQDCIDRLQQEGGHA